MSHRTYINKTYSGWFVWVCCCGDQAPNAFRWKIAASYHANRHAQKKEKVHESR